MADIRVTQLPVLAAPDATDILHVVDTGDNKDKQATIAAVIALAQAGTATAAQGAKADSALQPGDVDLGYTPTTRTITNTGGDPVVLPVATTSQAGLMAGADKTKLDGIPAGGGSYTLPTATATVLGGVKIGSGITITNGVISAEAQAGTGTDLGYDPPTRLLTSNTGADVTLPEATATVPGLMAAADKSKLNGLSNYTLPVASASTLGGVKQGTGVTIAGDGTISAAGGGGGTVTSVTGTAPIQVSNGTSTPAVSITPATTSAPGSMSAADKVKLDTLQQGIANINPGNGLTGSLNSGTYSLSVNASGGITALADSIEINRTTTDTWYATAAQGAKADKALPTNAAGIAGAAVLSNIVSITQAAYDALGTKNASTLYCITA